MLTHIDSVAVRTTGTLKYYILWSKSIKYKQNVEISDIVVAVIVYRGDLHQER